MKIGKYTLIPIETGNFYLDGGAMFGIIPKPLWELSHPSDDMNRIELTTRCLLLVGDSRKILIDTGIGGSWDEKFNRIYKLQNNKDLVPQSLLKHDIKPEDITDVILTHLHFDHTGGSTYSEDGKWFPTFPNAKYYVQQHHYDWAKNPSEKDRGSFNVHRYEPLRDNGILHFTKGNEKFDDEIEFLTVNGHTFSQQLVKISDSSNTVLYCADLFAFATHIPIPYLMGYDLQPLLTIEEKKNILSTASKGEWILFFEHDPTCVAAKVSINKKGFMVKDLLQELK